MRSRAHRLAPALPLALLVIALACSRDGGDTVFKPGGGGSGGTPTDVDPGDDAPEVIVEIVDLNGASGAGFFQVGDMLGIRFRLKKEDDSLWLLDEMSAGRAMLSGPTINYQRVIPEVTDVVDEAIDHGDGTYTYIFASSIPAVYAAPYNDTPTFGAGDGELTGEDLRDGTYTVGLGFEWDYEVEGAPFFQVGEATGSFLLGGGAGAMAGRFVSQEESCNVCHTTLRAHGDHYQDYATCLLCHTAGAEDKNEPTVAGGTPDVTIDFKVMIHKLHNGSHLPSVLGFKVDATGFRDYTLTPKPYQVVGAGNVVHDYSDVGHPIFPNRSEPMLKPVGYLLLTPQAQAIDDDFRTGFANCTVCHGDPDGAGPIAAPADGDVIFVQMRRNSCGSCHDDWDPEFKYIGSLGLMPPQPDDTQCIFCHEGSFGGFLAVNDGHTHPLSNPIVAPDFNPGLNFDLIDVQEAGASDGDGTLDPGERVQVTFTIRDDAGADVLPANLDEIRVVVSGPTPNANLLLDATIPTALLAGAQPFVVFLPEMRYGELVGASTAGIGDVFTTAATPHLDLPGAETTVAVRTGLGGAASTLAAAASAGQNFLDLADASGFVRNDFVVVADGVVGLEEYLQVQFVDGNRIWFSSPNTPAYPPGVLFDHPLGTTVLDVTLALKVAAVDYALDAGAGQITELVEFGAGNAVLLTYTTAWEVPDRYPLAHNASPDLDETDGKWTGKSFVDGTYRVGIRGWYEKDFFDGGESNLYYISSPPAFLEVLGGGATTLEPYDLIDSGQNCNACHQDLRFHGGRDRGFDTCIQCHGTAGAEDLPRYVAASAPDTTGVTVSFRTLLHKVHRGKLLDMGATFTVVSAGADPYPDNFELNDYADIVFPPTPGDTKQCARCHGDGNTDALFPSSRNHPTEQGLSVLAWRAVCGACHDSTAAIAHIEVQTSPGGEESCLICHAVGEEEDVAVVHKAR